MEINLKENLHDLSSEIIYEVANKEKTRIEFTIPKNDSFSKIRYDENIQISIPKPRQIEDRCMIQGILFDDIEKSYTSIWSLYLAALYHSAGHAAVTDYSVYRKWAQRKSPELVSKVVQFIEDIRVKEYLKTHYTNPYQNLELMEFYCELLYEKYLKGALENNEKRTVQQAFKNKFNNFREEVKESIFNENTDENLVKLANKIYNNRKSLDIWEYPFKENIRPTNFTKYLKYLHLQPFGEFKQYSDKLGEMWIDENKQEDKMLKKYEKYAEDLHFDHILVSPENLGKYFQLRMDSSNLIKKIRNQVKLVTNTLEDPNTEDYGYIEMQKAIQATASESQGISFFEQDQELRYEESWAIVMDTSASMRIQFQDLQRFLMCIAEAADQINLKRGKWSIHGFNNDFVLIKDFNETYNDRIKARIGGLQNTGLSFIPDAMKLATRMLEDDMNERRYLFLITDGFSMGYHEINEEFQSAVKLAARAGINVIAIGVPDGMSKYFTVSFPHTEVRKTVAKFVNAYSSLAQQFV